MKSARSRLQTIARRNRFDGRREQQEQVPEDPASGIPASSRFRLLFLIVVGRCRLLLLDRVSRTGFRATVHVGLVQLRGPRRDDHRGQLPSLTVSALWPRAPTPVLYRCLILQIPRHGRSDRPRCGGERSTFAARTVTCCFMEPLCPCFDRCALQRLCYVPSFRNDQVPIKARTSKMQQQSTTTTTT
jgi:hypothetical protein